MKGSDAITQSHEERDVAFENSLGEVSLLVCYAKKRISVCVECYLDFVLESREESCLIVYLMLRALKSLSPFQAVAAA